MQAQQVSSAVYWKGHKVCTWKKRGKPKTRKCHIAVTHHLCVRIRRCPPTASATPPRSHSPGHSPSSSALQISLPTVCPLHGEHTSVTDSTIEVHRFRALLTSFCSHVRLFSQVTPVPQFICIFPYHRSEPYDPYLPRNGSSSNPAGGSSQGGNPKTAAIQQQIDDTVGIMRENITKVAERGERLDSLQDKTGA